MNLDYGQSLPVKFDPHPVNMGSLPVVVKLLISNKVYTVQVTSHEIWINSAY